MRLIEFFLCLSIMVLSFASHAMQIFVKGAGSKTFAIEVDYFESIASFKERIVNRTGITVDFDLKTSLHFLDPDKTFEDFKIVDGESVYISFPLKSCASCPACETNNPN